MTISLRYGVGHYSVITVPSSSTPPLGRARLWRGSVRSELRILCRLPLLWRRPGVLPWWDVEVGENTWWFVGVMTESLQRKGDYYSMSGQWCVGYKDGKYRASSTPQPSTLLTVKQKLQRIRVQLDWDRGELSFSDPDNNTHLHTLTHTFTERVFPYFNTACKLSPLRILPVRASVKVEQHSKR